VISCAGAPRAENSSLLDGVGKLRCICEGVVGVGVRCESRQGVAWPELGLTDTPGTRVRPGAYLGEVYPRDSGFGIFDHLSIIVHLISVLVVVQFFHGEYQLQAAGEGAAAVEAVHVEVKFQPRKMILKSPPRSAQMLPLPFRCPSS
jgi:hypothetical protein